MTLRIVQSTGNFIRGNAMGVIEASKTLFRDRPKHFLEMQQMKNLNGNTTSIKKYADFLTIGFNGLAASGIRDAYKTGGAQKSGEYLTQTPVEFAKKVVKFITGK